MSRMVRIDLIDPSPWADLFDHPEDHVSRLAEDIRERGIQTPLHVYPTGERFELLTGHDRLAAAKLAGLAEVPVETRSTLNDEDARFAYVVKDNTLRKDVDKRRICEATVLRHPEWSIRRLAEVAGCGVRLAHEVRAELEAKYPQLFPGNTVGKDGVAQPARKPAATGRRKDKPAGNEGAMRAAREAAYVDHDPTLDELGSDADDETKPDAPEPAPSPSQPHETEKEPDAAAPIAANLRRHFARPVDERIRTLIAAAHDMRGISDDELSALQTNDLMVEGLRLAVAQIGRIINLHDERGKSHANHRPSLAG